MTPTSVRVIIFGILVAAIDASAQRISLPDFSGRGAGAVHTQLVNQLCEGSDCVAATKVTVGGKPDMKKAKRELLQFFVTGTVSKAKKGKGNQVEIAVVSVKSGGIKAKRIFPLDKNGTLTARNLDAAVELVRGAIGTAGSGPQPAQEPEAEAEAPEPSATPAPSQGRPTSAETSETSEPSEPAEPSTAEREPETASTRAQGGRKSSSKPIIFAVELGSDIVNRKLSYANLTTGNLRQYDLPVYLMPTLKLEFYPLALGRTDLLSGLGLEAAFGIDPLLKSRRQTDETTEVYPTTALKIDAGVRWRIVVSPAFPLTVIPSVGLRVQSFEVGPQAGTTTRLGGLPNISFVGLRAAVGLEVPVVSNLIFLFGRFGILPIFSSGEIISVTYFPSGSTFGFEAAVGAAVQLAKFLQIRASFEFTQYGMTFKTEEADPFIASGAADRYLGGNIAARLQF